MSVVSGFFVASATTTWVVFGLTSACSAVRYVLQRHHFGQLLWEDYIHLTAWVQCFAYMIVYQLYVGADLYFFFVDNDPDNVQEFYFDITTAQSCLYWSTIFTSKAVLLALYRRLFGVSRMYRYAWWATVVITALASLAGFLSQFFYCDPDCISVTFPWLSRDLYILSLACNCGTDVLIMILPLYMLYRMHMSPSKKARLAPVFLLGLITITMDFLAWIFQIFQGNLYMYYTSVAFIGLEPPITVTIAALPALMFSSLGSRRCRGGHGGGDGGRPYRDGAAVEELPSPSSSSAQGSRLTEQKRQQQQQRWRPGTEERGLFEGSVGGGGSSGLLGLPALRDNFEASVMSEIMMVRAHREEEEDGDARRLASCSSAGTSQAEKGTLREAHSFC